ncbi:hypothetical protein SAMN05660337_1630 [Maridesulfovibrio ferrireducens]|uniref:Transposase n=1 Tax=Maridesulfovibrio ferrireducens TaxID=246191 RepID=A0A1G9FND5_9BACT|nr:hypothetical protein SAMN05660337_1630 [Maridesulfovibrio ferrireducens]
MKRCRMFFQHYLNPLHIFCRLRQAGLSAIAARRMSTVYEKLLYRMFLL